MLNSATLNQLHDLRLSAMASQFRQQMDTPESSSLSFEERFGILVETEWLARRDKRIRRLVKQAGFRFHAAIEDIDFQGKRGIAKADVLRLSLGAYIQKAQNIFISGPTGVGKTYLACALGNAACVQGVPALYIRVPDLFRFIFEARQNNRSFPLKDKCAKVPLLILDDWGLKKFSTEETAELSDIIEWRYGRAATIISSQIPSTAWHELFPDPTQADAILDRIVHNAYQYNISGESMRKTLGKRSLELSELS